MTARSAPLSARAVEGLKRTTSVGGAPGLQLLVSAGGARSWRLYYRLPGDPRRRAMGLGPYPSVTLADARARANEILGKAAAGVDPRAERNEAVRRRALTLAEALEDYLTWCARVNAPATVVDKRSALTNAFAKPLGRTPLVDLSRRQIVAALDALVDRPALRRSVYLYLRHFLGWALDRDLIDADPAHGLKPPKAVASRERVLSDDEIRALWTVEGAFATIARLSLMTAQRKGSIEAMRWSDLDLEAGVWSIPAQNMKSGRPHRVPLSLRAVAALRAWPRLSGDYVFGVGSDGEKPYTGASNGVIALRKALPAEDWRVHDIRRTAVTLAQRGAAPIDAIRALTQHKVPGVIGVYARHDFEAEKTRVVEAIEAVLAEILGPIA